MTQKRNSHSSVVSVEEESMDLLDFDAEKDDDSVEGQIILKILLLHQS